MNAELYKLDEGLKKFLLVFIILLTTGVSVGLVYLFYTTSMSPEGTISQFNGSRTSFGDDQFDIPDEYAKPITEYFTFADYKYSFIEAIPAGFSKTYISIGDYLKQLRLMFSPEVRAYENIGSFITIASIFPKTWDWENFWRLTAFLSIMLAILNLLPIPALDGGHTMFLLYEIVARRKPSDKFVEYSQVVGMILLFALMIFALGNDLLMHVF